MQFSVDETGSEKALRDIKEFGCHVLLILGEGELPPFAYSIGIFREQGAPEVTVVGLKQELAHSVVNEYNRRVRSGERFVAGAEYGGFIQGFRCRFEVVVKAYYKEYFGWGLWLYKTEHFPVLQLVYPNTSGVWPWEDDATDWFRQRQPILTSDGRPNAPEANPAKSPTLSAR